MLKDFPHSYKETINWGWSEFEPYAQELLERELTIDNLTEWLKDESQLLEMLHELNGRLAVAVDQNNNDHPARERRDRFREHVWPKTRYLINQFEQKLIDTNLTPPRCDIQLKNIRSNLEIFHADNVDLEIEERSYREQYETVRSDTNLDVNGENRNAYDASHILHTEPDRMKRKSIYKNILAARTASKGKYDAIWEKVFSLRSQIARNAGMPDYRVYMWKKLKRHDYAPQDVITFCEAIETVIVPIVSELRKQQASSLGVDTLKPWDALFQENNDPSLKPYQTVEDWLQKSRTLFNNISPKFANYFDIMQSEGLLDIEKRPNKSPWNYAEWLPASNRSFIFINGQGENDDLFMLFHEFGHAVQLIEMSNLPYIRQKMLPDEISEVASTTMELLASEHLSVFYTPEQAKVVRDNHLTSMIFHWPFVAMVALFQHWVYTHPDEGKNPIACDEYWLALCERFLSGIDYSDFEDDLRMQWREVFQVFVFPFYYIEYAFAQLGAVQVWKNYQNAPQETIDQIRDALSRGHTVSVPEFYALAGAKFAVDTETLKQVMGEIQKALIL